MPGSAPPAPPAPAALIAARWFDGQSSRPQPALVSLRASPDGPALLLHPLAQPGAAPRRFAWRDVGWPEAWHASRAQERLVVDLRAAGSLEIDDGAAWQAALAAAGQRPGLAQRMQTRWRTLAAVLVLAAASLFAFYRYGTPWLAVQLTRIVPLPLEQALAHDALARMDGGMLTPSKLPAARQQALRARFAALLAHTPPQLQRYDGYAAQYALEFRSGMPPNAFALPGGTIVMSDALVQTTDEHSLGDDALVGVLAHEAGHVAHRHTTRMLVEQGVLQIGLGLALGDVSGLLSSGGALLTGLAYRRGHEREADCHAIVLMRHAHLPTAPMADLLLAMEHDADKDKKKDKGTAVAAQPAGAPAPAPRPSGELEALLSSHPETQERARRLRTGDDSQCAR